MKDTPLDDEEEVNLLMAVAYLVRVQPQAEAVMPVSYTHLTLPTIVDV